MTRYRCQECGNKTRFDVVETKRVRSFLHLSLGGESRIEQEEVLSRTVEQVVCRWCGATLPERAGASAPPDSPAPSS